MFESSENVSPKLSPIKGIEEITAYMSSRLICDDDCASKFPSSSTEEMPLRKPSFRLFVYPLMGIRISCFSSLSDDNEEKDPPRPLSTKMEYPEIGLPPLSTGRS